MIEAVLKTPVEDKTMDFKNSEKLIAMNINLKILTGGVVLALSAMAIAPAQAEYNMQQGQTSSQSQREQSQKRLGRVVSVSGSTATVEMSNGKTKTVEMSSNDMDGMAIAPGAYVVVSDNEITGVAQVGTIRSMTGSLANVELENGDSQRVRVSRAEIGAMNLIEGTRVYVADDEIIAAAIPVDTTTSQTSTDGTMQSQSGSMESDTTDTTGGTGTRVQQGSDNTGGGMGGTQTQQETAPTNNQSGYTGQEQEGTGTQTQDGSGGVYNTQPQTDTQTPGGTGTGTYETQPETDTQTPGGTGTYETQPETDTQTQESEEPVRGMW